MATILVVEDNPEIADITRQLLEFSGYRVHTSASARDALATIARHPIDLVFTDVRLGAESGVWLAEEISRNHPSIVVVLTTGYSSERAGLAASPWHLVLKPYVMSQLVDAFDRALGRRGTL